MPHPLTIIAATGIVFLIAFYCWVKRADNPFDEDADSDPDFCGWYDTDPRPAEILSSLHDRGDIR